MKAKRIKVFGERNSGTNYISTLLQTNLEVTLLRGTVPNFEPFISKEWAKEAFYKFTAHNNLGWKHAEANLPLIKSYFQLDSLYLVTITKNPYSFLLSLYDNPHQIIGPRSLTFSDFIRTKWFSQKRENTRKYFESPIDLWNTKNASYLQLKKEFPDRCILLTYESLVRDPEEAIGLISRQFSLSMITPFNNMVVSSKKNGKFFTDYQDYYLKKRWRKRLVQDDIEFINAKLDFHLLDFYGYSRVL